jgi:hypothetical protein
MEIESEITKRNHIKRGFTGSRIHNSYKSMKARCNNPKSTKYPNYGGRGITICDRWLESFQNFYADMGDMPEGRTLDRINNELGYYPENCRWATITEQNQNQRPRGKTSKLRGVYFDKSRNVFRSRVTVNGVQKNIGRFETEYECGFAYDMFVIKNNLPNILNGEALYNILCESPRTNDNKGLY